jgi:uncharacterized membrane protein YccC
MENLMSCPNPNCKKLHAEHEAALKELRKHLTSMHEHESLVGGIRNLATIAKGYRQRIQQLEHELKLTGSGRRT